AIKNLDREVFFGPFRRYTEGVTWSTSDMAPLRDRWEPITSVYLRGWNSVDAAQIRYGETWGRLGGSMSGGVATQLDLSPDEWIDWVEVWSEHNKLGKLTFWTNKKNSVG